MTSPLREILDKVQNDVIGCFDNVPEKDQLTIDEAEAKIRELIVKCKVWQYYSPMAQKELLKALFGDEDS